jgi:hypothetical protein
MKTGSRIVGNPMTHLGPDGKQYVAVYSGVGGWMGAVAFPSGVRAPRPRPQQERCLRGGDAQRTPGAGRRPGAPAGRPPGPVRPR